MRQHSTQVDQQDKLISKLKHNGLSLVHLSQKATVQRSKELAIQLPQYGSE